MPIYEYICQSCKGKTEVLQRLRERPLRICPHCGGKLKKAFSAPAIQFKGTGWYVTDYARAKKEEKAAPSEKGASSEGGTSSEKAASSEKGESEQKPAEGKKKRAAKE